MIGVIAPAVAWPTIYMPIEYALITQFAAFTFLYFVDARATVRGWAPPWYATYRFVLTFIVGASIVISLIGRGRIVKEDAALRSPADYVKKDTDAQWVALKMEDEERMEKLKKEGDEKEKGEKEEDEKEKDEKEADEK